MSLRSQSEARGANKKWLTGSNALHARLYFNRASKTIHLDVPVMHGSPGARSTFSLIQTGPYSAVAATKNGPASRFSETKSKLAKGSSGDGLVECHPNRGRWH